MSKGYFRLFYAFGMFVTLLAAGIAIWPDFESRNFSQTFTGDRSARLRCPIAITSAETSTIDLTLRNDLDRRALYPALSFLSTSSASIVREERQETYIDAKGSEQLSWNIDQSNAAYGYMVLARVYVFRSGRAPSASAACGVWLFSNDMLSSLGIKGDTVFWTLAAAGLGSLAIGGVGLSETKNPFAFVDRRTSKPRFGVPVTLAVLFAFLFGLLGIPMAGIACLMLGSLFLLGLLDRGTAT